MLLHSALSFHQMKNPLFSYQYNFMNRYFELYIPVTLKGVTILPDPIALRNDCRHLMPTWIRILAMFHNSTTFFRYPITRKRPSGENQMTVVIVTLSSSFNVGTPLPVSHNLTRISIDRGSYLIR